MVFESAHTVHINQSTLNEVHGDYYHNTPVAGERGIAELFKAACPDAFHDSNARYPPPHCHPGTRIDVLKEIFGWIDNSHEKILWMSGPAGAGKSALAQKVAEDCAPILAASFFFFHAGPGRDTSSRLVASIIYQIAIAMRYKRAQIGNIVEADPSILHKPLEIQIKRLILPLFSPPSSYDVRAEAPPFLVIIDGLDECKGDSSQREVVRHIGDLANTTGVPLRFLIVSRPEPQIEQSFRCLPLKFHHISLGDQHHIHQAHKDVYMYLRHGFDEIYQKHTLIMEEFWPGDDVLSTLVYKSGGMFIYASTVLKYIDDEDYNPAQRLREVLDTPPGLTPFAELDYLYRRVVGAYPDTRILLRVLTVVSLLPMDEQLPIIEWPPLNLKGQLVGSRLLVGNRQLPIGQKVELLLQLQKGGVTMVLRRMRSILEITQHSISFYHKSFTDFIHNKERAGEFFIGVKEGNAFLAQELLRLLGSPTRCAVLSRTRQDLIHIAQNYWWKCCKLSGTWDEHPELLEEISKALDDSDLLPLGNGFGDSDLLTSLEWFEVPKIQPIQSCKYYTLEVQYRLFHMWWKTMLNLDLYTQYPLHIFTIYEDNYLDHYQDLEFMIGHSSCNNIGTSPFIINGPGRVCLIFRENCSIPLIRMYYKTAKNWRSYDHLFRRLLPELECLKEYRADIVYGDAEVTVRFLDKLCSVSFHQSTLRTASYARKYWTKYLLKVQPGNQDICDALKRFERSYGRPPLNIDEIKAVREWLESSGVAPYGAWKRKVGEVKRNRKALKNSRKGKGKSTAYGAGRLVTATFGQWPNWRRKFSKHVHALWRACGSHLSKI